MSSLRNHIKDIPDFPQPGILFRDIVPLLRDHFDQTLDELTALLPKDQWDQVDAIAGIEARGFILAAGLAGRQRKGFVPIRKAGKLPPPVVKADYALEYGTSAIEMQRGSGRLLIVDDVLATGGTMQAAAQLADQAGYEVADLIALIDLNLCPSFTWRDLKVRSLISY